VLIVKPAQLDFEGTTYFRIRTYLNFSMDGSLHHHRDKRKMARRGGPDGGSLFIGRLSRNTRVRDLEEIFESYGRMTRCDIKYGKCCGFDSFVNCCCQFTVWCIHL